MPNTRRSLLIAPHQFPDLEREKALARELDLALVVAADQEQFTEAMADAAIVMVTPYAKVQERDFARMRGCRGVVRYGIGFDNIDVEAARAHNVAVSIVPDASTEEVASHAFALGLMLSRRIPQGQEAIAARAWAAKVPFDGPVLSELHVGIIGMGRIGRRVAAWWRDVGAQVTAYDPIAHFEDVPSAPVAEILENSHVVSLHVPLTDETRHMISAETITRMRPNAVIVNVSRGGLIDEEALAVALTEGRLAGAGLDVFEQEPLPADHPLRTAPNAVLTPHSAWKSSSSLAALQSGAVSRARSFLEGGTPPDIVS